MTAIRVARRKRFTVIDRTALNDASLSYRARGILAWLLDKPDDWRTNADSIASGGREGRDAVRAALTELETIGYLSRRTWRDLNGKWACEWTVWENPKAHTEPQRVSSDGKPATVNQRRITSAGEPQRETRPLTEDEEPNTDITTEPTDLIFQADEEARKSAVPPPWVDADMTHAEWLASLKDSTP